VTDAPKIVLTQLGDAGAMCEGDVCEIPATRMGSETTD